MCFWQCVSIIALIVSVFSPVNCRNNLHLELVDGQQQGETTTSLSLTHSVKIYEQHQDSSPRLRRRVHRLQRQRQSVDTDQSVTGFDWEAYLALNPDLSLQRYGSENKAWRHYRLYLKATQRRSVHKPKRQADIVSCTCSQLSELAIAPCVSGSMQLRKCIYGAYMFNTQLLKSLLCSLSIQLHTLCLLC